MSKSWLREAQKKLDAAVANVRDKDAPLAECVLALHDVVARLGGASSFARLAHAALMDDDIDASAKANMLAALMNFWMVSRLLFDRRERQQMDGLTEDQLEDAIASLLQKSKHSKGRLGKKGRTWAGGKSQAPPPVPPPPP